MLFLPENRVIKVGKYVKEVGMYAPSLNNKWMFLSRQI